MYEIKRLERVSQTLVHFVKARASLFTDHKIAGPHTCEFEQYCMWEIQHNNAD